MHELDEHQAALMVANLALLDSLSELEREKAWLLHVDFLYEKLSSLLHVMQVGLCDRCHVHSPDIPPLPVIDAS